MGSGVGWGVGGVGVGVGGKRTAGWSELATCMEHLLLVLISVIFSPPLPTSLRRSK